MDEKTAVTAQENLKREKKVPLVESFGPTIQGEGSVIGMQTMFLRFGGCDYRCERCDSLHAVLPQLFMPTARRMTNAELLEHTLEIAKHTEWITFSGGNPCMWDLMDLVEGLQEAGHRIAVETQGTLLPNWLPRCDVVTISPKGPGMREPTGFEYDKFAKFVDLFRPTPAPNESENGFEHVMWHTGFCVKVVVFDQRDIEFMVSLIQRWPQLRDVMYASIGNVNPPAPAVRDDDDLAHGEFVVKTLRNYEMIANDIWNDPRCRGIRILPQLHTLVWGNKAGV